ncbi:hypothetical protein [Ruegeria hyattellae]|uniref:hypothetical protein n=1 Tax=Ruegeria hyattellae TaxID=3233337 RepID=UPI00355B6BE5
MRVLWRWVGRLFLVLALLGVVLVAPVIYVEVRCQGDPIAQDYAALLPPEHHRAESRTFMTYPEWHIVHAYDDYGKVISTGDPHDYGYLRSIGAFWSSLCHLSERSAAHGGIDGSTKQMVYVIGSSFTLELMMKAAYEETIGRVATMIRGSVRTETDDLSAQQAAGYARFLQQIPWYKWDFRMDSEALDAVQGQGFRDTERKTALGLEYAAKAAYADVIAAAVEGVGADELTLRMVVRGTDPIGLASYNGVELVERHSEGFVIETPRYRALTTLLVDMAGDGIDFVEIAGNDDILLTAISSQTEHSDALYSFARQGYGDYRHLIVVKVTDLAERLRQLNSDGLELEHIHDY